MEIVKEMVFVEDFLTTLSPVQWKLISHELLNKLEAVAHSVRFRHVLIEVIATQEEHSDIHDPPLHYDVYGKRDFKKFLKLLKEDFSDQLNI